MDRQKQIVRVSLVGIAANLVLVAFKAAVGLITGSIAVTLDAVNNLSDALSSVLTIAGTKLAARKPDKKHPYGHGRIENITAVAIAVIVLLAGAASFRESVTKILHPQRAEYTAASLVIITAAVLVKLLLGRYVKRAGEKYNSDSLTASGADALFDAVISLSTLAAAAVSLIWHISIEGWLGAVISAVILKAGVEILLDSLNSIIGARVDSDLTNSIKATVCSFPEVHGAYDLTLHRYGPEKIIGSVHVEVDDDMTAREIHKLTRQIAVKVFTEFGIILTVGIYATNTDGEREQGIRRDVEQITAAFPEVLQTHGFYMEPGSDRASLDLVIDFSADPRDVCRRVKTALKERFPELSFDIIPDNDISDV